MSVAPNGRYGKSGAVRTPAVAGRRGSGFREAVCDRSTVTLYSEEEGRKSVDPVVLFKIVLLRHLDGNTSLRGTLRRAETDVAYRWFLRYRLSEELPHFSTVSYNFLHRYTPETIDAVFQWILDEANAAGALTPTAVFIDGTHIKANANLKKKIKQEVPVAAKRYGEETPKSGSKRRNNTSKKKLARRKK